MIKVHFKKILGDFFTLLVTFQLQDQANFSISDTLFGLGGAFSWSQQLFKITILRPTLAFSWSTNFSLSLLFRAYFDDRCTHSLIKIKIDDDFLSWTPHSLSKIKTLQKTPPQPLPTPTLIYSVTFLFKKRYIFYFVREFVIEWKSEKLSHVLLLLRV